jgi:hypothetical protein
MKKAATVIFGWGTCIPLDLIRAVHRITSTAITVFDTLRGTIAAAMTSRSRCLRHGVPLLSLGDTRIFVVLKD